MKRSQTLWSPWVGEYVRIAATGELGPVAEAAGLVAASPLHVVYRLHELGPRPRPSSRGASTAWPKTVGSDRIVSPMREWRVRCLARGHRPSS